MEFVNLEINVRPIKVGYDKKKYLLQYRVSFDPRTVGVD